MSIQDPTVDIDFDKWGLDHGTWAVLRHIYPDANVPVLQLSLAKNKPMEFYFEFGQKLRFLRKQGVLIMGSGNIVHNLRQIDWNTNAKPHNWAVEFDEWAKQKLLERDFQPLVIDAQKTKAGQLSIPTLEHYLPLL